MGGCVSQRNNGAGGRCCVGGRMMVPLKIVRRRRKNRRKNKLIMAAGTTSELDNRGSDRLELENSGGKREMFFFTFLFLFLCLFYSDSFACCGLILIHCRSLLVWESDRFFCGLF